MIAATVILLPFAAVTTAMDGIELTPTRVVSILLLGAMGTGVAYLLNYRSIAELGSTKASVVTYLVPVVAVVVGVLFLDEAFESAWCWAAPSRSSALPCCTGASARPRRWVAVEH